MLKKNPNKTQNSRYDDDDGLGLAHGKVDREKEKIK